jgi:hypothetical protein
VKADSLCPAEANRGWVTWLTIYRELDLEAPAAGLIATIRAAPDVPEAARAAAVAWRRALDQKPAAPAAEAPAAAVEERVRAAEAAFGKEDWATAARLFGEVKLSGGQVVLERTAGAEFDVLRGVSLLRAGQPREGHAAIERGLASLTQGAPPTLETTFNRAGPSAISSVDGTIYLASGEQLTIHDPASLRRRAARALGAELGKISEISVAPGEETLGIIGAKGVQIVGAWERGWQPQLTFPRSLEAVEGWGFRNNRFYLFGRDLTQIGWSPQPGAGWQSIDARPWVTGVPLSAPDNLAPPAGPGLLLDVPGRDQLVLLAPGAGSSRAYQTGPLVRSHELSPRGTTFALALPGGRLAVVDVASGHRRWTSKGGPEIKGLRYLDDERLLVESGVSLEPSPERQRFTRKRQIVDVATGKKWVQLEGPPTESDKTGRYQLRPGGESVVLLGPDFLSWDATTGKQSGHAARPCSRTAKTALLPDGRALCLEFEELEGTVLVDAATGERRLVHGHHHIRTAQVALSQGAEALAMLDYSGTLHHFNLRDGTWKPHPDAQDRLRTDREWAAAARVAVSPDGGTVAWSLPKKSGTHLAVVRRGELASAELADDELSSLSASAERLLACPRKLRPMLAFALPSLAQLPDLVRLPDKDTDTRCALSPDGRWFACSARFGEIALRDARTGQLSATLSAPRAVSSDTPGAGSSLSAFDRTTHLLFSSDGKVLAAGNMNEVHVWDVEHASLTAIIPATNQTPEPLFSPDGSRLALTTPNALVRLLSAPWATPLASIEREATRVFFSGDGRRLTLLSDDHLVALDDESRLAHETPLRPAGEARRNIAHAPGAGLFAVVTDDGVLLIDEASGEVRATLRTLRQGKGWYALTPQGLADWEGDVETLRQVLTCRVGAQVFPLEACEDRVRVPGLLRRVARGERPSLDPEP